MEEILKYVGIVVGSGTFGVLIKEVFNRNKSKAEASAVDIESEVKLNDAWKENYFALNKEIKELRIMYDTLIKRSYSLTAEIEKYKSMLDSKDKQLLGLRDIIKKKNQEIELLKKKKDAT